MRSGRWIWILFIPHSEFRIQMLHDRRESDGGGVGTAAAERGDVAVFVDALEAGDDDDHAVVQCLPHACGRDALDARFRVRAVGDDADLRAGEADGAFAERLNRYRHERDGDLLSRREKHVHLARRRLIAQFLGQFDQFIGGVAASADDDNDLMAGLPGANGFARRRLIRSAVATLLPPNFCTTNDKVDTPSDDDKRAKSGHEGMIHARRCRCQKGRALTNTSSRENRIRG